MAFVNSRLENQCEQKAKQHGKVAKTRKESKELAEAVVTVNPIRVGRNKGSQEKSRLIQEITSTSVMEEKLEKLF